MGNKIITEKDYWRCTGGLMPAQLQSRQSVAKKNSGEKYITEIDTATSSSIDFSCSKLMFIMAILAAVIAVCIAATGGLALIAIGAMAGAAGALAGAAVGSLVCGQLAALARMWLGQKQDMKILGKKAITGDHSMTCMLFGDTITFAPEIKNWAQAYAEGGANLIKGVFDGMLAGACVGMGGAAAGGIRSLLGAGGKEAAKQISINFLKSAPRSMLQNIRSGFAGDWAMKGLEATQGWLQTYANTGTASLENFTDGVKESSFGDVNAMKKIFTGQATSADYLAAVFLLLPGNAPGGNKPKNTSNIVDGTPNNKAKDADGGSKKKDQDGDDGNTTKNRGNETQNNKKKGDNEAYTNKMKKTSPDPPFEISKKHKGDPKLEAEYQKQLKDQQDAINKMSVKDWLTNRKNFDNRNKKQYKKDTKKARDDFRKQELDRRTKENIRKGIRPKEKAKQKAIDSMKGEAALHNPDGVAGGDINDITGMGSSRVNSSLGSQWGNGKAASLESQINNAYGIPPKTINDVPVDDIMNVNLF